MRPRCLGSVPVRAVPPGVAARSEELLDDGFGRRPGLSAERRMMQGMSALIGIRIELRDIQGKLAGAVYCEDQLEAVPVPSAATWWRSPPSSGYPPLTAPSQNSRAFTGWQMRFRS